MHAQANACHEDPALRYVIRIRLRTTKDIFTVLVVGRSRRRSLASSTYVRTEAAIVASYPSTVVRSNTYCNFKVCLGSVENDARSKSPTDRSNESLVRGTDGPGCVVVGTTRVGHSTCFKLTIPTTHWKQVK